MLTPTVERKDVFNLVEAIVLVGILQPVDTVLTALSTIDVDVKRVKGEQQALRRPNLWSRRLGFEPSKRRSTSDISFWWSAKPTYRRLHGEEKSLLSCSG